MTAADPEGRIRHQLDVFHSTLDAAGSFIAAGLVPVADGLGQVDYVDSSTFGGSLPWYNVVDYGAVHDAASTSDADIAAATDDTVAIQAAIDACFAAGGGTVFFPPGIYAIKGVLQSTSTYNSQLKIPNNAATNPPIAITFMGLAAPAITQDSPITSFPVGLSGAILRSDWNGTISGSPAVIAAGTRAAVYPSGAFNWVHVTFKNIEIRCHSNPKLTAIQMSSTGMCQTSSVTVSTQVDPSSMALPSNTNAIGIDMPTGLNSNFGDQFDRTFVDGFYIGATLSEQTTGPSLATAHCQIGILANGSASTHHAANLGRLLTFSCKYGIRFTGAESWLSIGLWNIEHDTGTMATTYDIDDASNYGHGFIGYHAVAYAGTEERLILNGATKFSFYNDHFQEWKLNSVVDIPTGTDPSTNPATGGRFYAASATGHPTWRDSAGTVTDLLSTGPAFATPAIVLGTAAAAGSASTVIRSDSTIVAFTSAIPLVESGSGVAGTAAKASREDHVHPVSASGGIGPILISDTPSTPLIFADLIQNEAQTDLVYADP
jgi:hypothetical protein